MNRRASTAILLGTLLLIPAAVSAAQNETYRARLSVVPLDAAMQSTVAGSGAVTATLVGNRLTIEGNFQGLRSPATDAHIYRGPKGIPGPAILDLTAEKATGGAIAGIFDLSPSQLADLRGEQFYIQLNSERAPDGNLRGWLLH